MLAELADYTYYNKISCILFLPLILVFIMSMLDLIKTKYLFKSLFNNSFFYRYPYDVIHKISLYQIISYLFITVVFALFLTVLLFDRNEIYHQFLNVYKFSLCLSAVYFFIKYLISEVLFVLFGKKTYVKQFFVLENSYLIVVLLFMFLVFCYTFLHLNMFNFMWSFTLFLGLLLYVIRLIVLFLNNKNLLSGKVLFIILYLCTLEIVPFIYLFKSYTE